MSEVSDNTRVSPFRQGGQFVSSRRRRTYFNNPLIPDCLQHLPAAVQHPTGAAFRDYLVHNLHYNSRNTRERFARYISQRFSTDGAMNLDLARAIARFGDSAVGREILYFEFLQAVPLLLEIASGWLAALPEEGGPRSSLLAFLEPRLRGRDTTTVAEAAVKAFRQCGKLTIPKLANYRPVRAEPSQEAFLYMLARLYPEPTMVRVDLFTGEPVFRGMLWSPQAMDDLLRGAQEAGHVSKVSKLDQYHQFTLSGTGTERLQKLLGPFKPTPAPAGKGPEPIQLHLFPVMGNAGNTPRPTAARKTVKKPRASPAPRRKKRG